MHLPPARRSELGQGIAQAQQDEVAAEHRSEADRLTRVALGDFELVLRLSQPRWDRLGEHGRGEVLGALADGWLMLDEADRADVFLDRMIAELPGTPYAKNGAIRRADPMARTPLTCPGCH